MRVLSLKALSALYCHNSYKPFSALFSHSDKKQDWCFKNNKIHDYVHLTVYGINKKERKIHQNELKNSILMLLAGTLGPAILIEFNFLREKGAFLYDEEAKTFSVDSGKMRQGVKESARKFLILEGDKSYENAAQFIVKYGKLDNLTQKTLKRFEDIPVDIEPIFRFKF